MFILGEIFENLIGTKVLNRDCSKVNKIERSGKVGKLSDLDSLITPHADVMLMIRL